LTELLPNGRTQLANFAGEWENVEQLVRWRLFLRTGAGLMAELGSHQLDACSIFIGNEPDSDVKKRPLAVTAVGGKHFYKDDREVEDHVYCIYEFPGPHYDRSNPASRNNDIVTVTYSSISTNGFEPYGECVMGTKGTMVVETEQAAYLWGIGTNASPPRTTEVTANAAPGGRPVLDASASIAPTERAAAATGQNAIGHAPPSKGYREEMEHLAYCIRSLGASPSPEERKRFKPRCDGRAAMADAIIALTANQAMKKRTRIAFDPDWFKAESEEIPDGDMVPRQIS
jgi:predicted dehydrogenase